MKKKAVIFIVMLCMHMLFVFGQEGNQETSYKLVQFPPSPEANALSRFDEYPVNKSTGLPDISIPLFEINEGGISLPITIRYHAGGIKVQDEPSIVGIGWSLSFGGHLSRSVRGLPDEGRFGFIENGTKVPSYNSILYGLWNDNLIHNTHYFLTQAVSTNRDYEPDLFSYSFGQKSGSFMFGNDMQIYNIPYDGTIIEPIFHNIEGGNKMKGFMAMDDEGVNYLFGNVLENDIGYTESTQLENWQDSPQPLFTSSWLLRKIYNPFSNYEIEFEYMDNPVPPTELLTESKTYTLEAGGWDEGIQRNDIIYSNHLARTIKKIYLNNRTIEFIYSDYFFNSANRKKLDRIIYKENAAQGLEMYVDFEYSFNNVRLRLDKVIMRSNRDSQNKEYQLEYDERALPPINSSDMDHWGYFNSAGNTSLLPNVAFGNTLFLGNGADRRPNENYTGVGSLKKIIYPTGGYTSYIFEQNSFERNKTIEDLTMMESFVLIEATHSSASNTINLNQTFADLIENDLILPGSFKLEAQLIPHHPCGPNYYTDEEGSVHLKRDGEIIATLNLFRTTTECELEKEINIPLDFEVHEYTLEAELATSMLNTKIIGKFFYTYYDKEEFNYTVTDYGGGQRVKRIENYDHVTGIVNIRSYAYEGYLTSNSKPQYHTYNWSKHMDGQNGYGCTTTNTSVTISHSASSGLGSSANSVAYSRVIEYFGTENENTGQIQTFFKTATDDHTGHGAPFFPRNSFQWQRSLPLKEIVLQNTGNISMDTLKKTLYSYEDVPDLNYKIRTFKVSRKYSYNCSYISDEELRNEFIYDNYEYPISNLRAKSIRNVDYVYNQNSLERVITDKLFQYENPLSQKPTSTTTQNSKKQEMIVETRYPSYYVFADCYEPCMNNYLSAITQCSTIDNQAIIDLTPCLSLWGEGIIKFRECSEICETGCNNFLNNSNYRNYYLCKTAIHDQYFKEGGLVSNCLENLDYDGQACFLEAINNYIDCKSNIQICISEKFQNATLEKDKAKFLFAQYEHINKLIEKRIIKNDRQTEHTAWNYGFFDLGNQPEIPLIRSIDNFHDNNITSREVEVHSYDINNKITQLSYNNSQPFSSFKWGENSNFPEVRIENAQYFEVYYEGFEEHANGVIFNYNGANHSKTGKKAFPGGSFTIPSSFSPTADALLSYWYFTNGTWMQYVGPFVRNINSGGSYLDEIRVYPKASMITSYSYDSFGKLVSSSDPNSYTNYYEYDGLGRLILVRDNDYSILKSYEYNYAH